MMAILGIMAVFVHQKSDIRNNMAISLWLILIGNPFAICNTGLILSYSATLGIVLLSPIFMAKAPKSEKNTWQANVLQKIKEVMIVSVSAWVSILPINMVFFQTISLTFLGSNVMVSFLMGLIVPLGFLISLPIWLPILPEVLNILLKILIWTSEVFSGLSLSHILVCPPPITVILLYFLVLLTWVYLRNLKKKPYQRRMQRQFLTHIEQRKKWLWQYKVRVVAIVSIFIIGGSCFGRLPQDLKICFIDVGQGDCTLIKTPNHKTILMDGGGSKNNEEYDVGKSVVLPYLLNHHTKRIDMMVVSHFDADHCNGLVSILENLEVKSLIIGKQKEETKEYKQIIEIAKKKKITLQIVEKKNQINIEKDLWFDVLYPEETLSLQGLNNNSLVLTLNYHHFKMLFTGDIEKEAEQKLLTTYQGTDTLKANVIKLAHHGSKTSTTKEFLKAVTPQIALIGVGKNNIFGHPNQEVLERLKRMWKQDF